MSNDWTKIGELGRVLAAEPPFRLFSNKLVKHLPFSIRTKARWNAVARPHYLLGVLRAADQAREMGLSEICVCEFGVAGGGGLLEMQSYAEAVEKETGIRISVYGFDTGKGLPEPSGDYRDHPEIWVAGDFPMDLDQLKRRLTPRTAIILGDVKDTAPDFVHNTQRVHVGFVAIDLDFYTATREALKILSLPDRKTLIRVILYFDDVETILYHRFAGELLAIEEFNADNDHVKIDRWRGLRGSRVFPDETWIDRMYVAYDLEAMQRYARNPKTMHILDPSDPTGRTHGEVFEIGSQHQAARRPQPPWIG